MSIVSFRVLKVRNPTNRLQKIEINQESKKNLLTLARMTTYFLRVSITDLPSLAILDHHHLSWPLSNTPAMQKHRTSSRSCYTAGFSLATRCGILNTPQTFPSLTFLGHFPILLPCKNTELAHAAVIQLALVQLLVVVYILNTPQTFPSLTLM